MAGKWSSAAAEQRVRQIMTTRMRDAMLLLQGDVQRRVSRGQPVKRIGGRLRGLNPSLPGESPKVVTGRLRQSITHDVQVEGSRIRGRVGSNVPYARRLEFGFFGTDSMGRNVNQQERPYLRPALKEKLGRLAQILTRGR